MVVPALATSIKGGFGPQASTAVGISNSHGVPHSTILSDSQVMFGGVVSTMVMVWVQMLLLPQESLALHVRGEGAATRVQRNAPREHHASRYNALALSRYSMAFCRSVILNFSA